MDNIYGDIFFGFHSFVYSNRELKIKVEWKDVLVLLLLLVEFPKGAILCFILIPLFVGTWFSRFIQN